MVNIVSKKPSNSSGVTSGTQFVQARDGTVNYSPIPFEQYAGSMGNAFGQANKAQSDILNQIAGLAGQDPRTQATAYSTKRTADAAYKQAEAAYIQAQNSGRDSRDSSQSNQSPRPYQPTTSDRLFNPEYQSAMSYENKARDGVNRFATQYEFANNRANRDLDRFVADSRLSETKLNTQAQLGAARINQPLSAGQILDKTRIENPDPMKSNAMNLLGGYSQGNGSRSNFAYWG